MKTYIIASSEYEANWPDMFLMDANGNYYGVSEHSYAKFHKFPGVEHWRKSSCSDEGRRFFIDEVDLRQDQKDAFEKITKEYTRLEMERPVFGESYPLESEYKTKKAYRQAAEEHMQRYKQWLKDSGAMKLSIERGQIWKERAKMFLSFSNVVADCLSDNDNIKDL